MVEKSMQPYVLPDTDVQSARRNFPGYTEAQLCTLEDLQQGDTSGTTDTDSQTDPPYPGYTRLNSALTGKRGISMGGTKMGIGPMAAGFAAH